MAGSMSKSARFFVIWRNICKFGLNFSDVNLAV